MPEGSSHALQRRMPTFRPAASWSVLLRRSSSEALVGKGDIFNVERDKLAPSECARGSEK